MGGAWQREAEAAVVREFLKLLAVCHTVIPEGTPQPATIKYQARGAQTHSVLLLNPCSMLDTEAPVFALPMLKSSSPASCDCEL